MGDLTQKITVPVQGTVMVQLKDVINAMVINTLHNSSSWFTRLTGF